MSIHIDNKAPVARTVLMPGDPLRAKFIAENFLTDPVRYTEIRSMYGYTGTYKGVPVSVQGSGMGIASMGLYSWELFSEHGVENIIRVGTAGSFSPAIHVGDVVLGLAASTDSNYLEMFGVNGTYSPSCSYDLLCEVQAASREAGIPVTAGNILSSDHFYEIDPNWWKPWQKMNVLAVEMESTALYANAAYLGKKALTLLTVSDHFVLDEIASAKERETMFTDMMKLALEAAVRHAKV